MKKHVLKIKSIDVLTFERLGDLLDNFKQKNGIKYNNQVSIEMSSNLYSLYQIISKEVNDKFYFRGVRVVKI